MKLFNRISEFALRTLPLTVAVLVVMSVWGVVQNSPVIRCTDSGSFCQKTIFELPSTPSGTDRRNQAQGDLLEALPMTVTSAVISRRNQEPVMPGLFRDGNADLFEAGTRIAVAHFRNQIVDKSSIFSYQRFLRLSLPPRASPVTV